MIVVSIINHSYWSYVQQLSPHKSAINHIESSFLLAKSQFSGLGRGFTRWAPWGTSYEDLGPSSPPCIEAILAPECDDVQKSHVRWCTEYIYIYTYYILYIIYIYDVYIYTSYSYHLSLARPNGHPHDKAPSKRGKTFQARNWIFSNLTWLRLQIFSGVPQEAAKTLVRWNSVVVTHRSSLEV